MQNLTERELVQLYFDTVEEMNTVKYLRNTRDSLQFSRCCTKLNNIKHWIVKKVIDQYDYK